MGDPKALTYAFAEAAAELIAITDGEGRLTYVNPAFSQSVLGGRGAAGEVFSNLFDHASSDRLAQAMERLVEGPQQVELYHLDKDGQPRPIHYSLTLIQGGVAALGRDKTPDLELLGEIVQLNIQLQDNQQDLAGANARLEQLAITDHITGLYNRHHFFAATQHMFEEARRYQLPMCCFMMDADHFKGLNDRFGHIFGDHVLKNIAERLRRGTRRSDVLARYGGEEFVMVAPQTDFNTGLMLADRLRAAIEAEPFTLGNASAQATMSFGISSTEVVIKGAFEDLLHAADQALYRAKQSGRNRCVLYTPEASGEIGRIADLS